MEGGGKRREEGGERKSGNSGVGGWAFVFPGAHNGINHPNQLAPRLKKQDLFFFFFLLISMSFPKLVWVEKQR